MCTQAPNYTDSERQLRGDIHLSATGSVCFYFIKFN